jgi:NTP pyrophosphatase (non-canonical NTP hydrolase)
MQNKTNVIGWSEQRGIYDYDNGSTPQAQLFKFAEELGETYGAILKNKEADIKDGIGDMRVVQINVEELIKRNGLLQMELSNVDETMLKLLADVGYAATLILQSHANKTEHEPKLTEVVGSIDADIVELAAQLNYDGDECLANAFDVIKDRKGKMMNRVFVKEDDLSRMDYLDLDIDEINDKYPINSKWVITEDYGTLAKGQVVCISGLYLATTELNMYDELHNPHTVHVLTFNEIAEPYVAFNAEDATHKVSEELKLNGEVFAEDLLLKRIAVSEFGNDYLTIDGRTLRETLIVSSKISELAK